MTMTILGKYEILEEVGRGGFGVVYTARDTTLNRIVALKVLKPMLLEDPAFMARFQQEAQIAAGLDHPNIVTIYELGESEGKRFIAMKYLVGQSLDKIIAKEGCLPLDRASRLITQIAAALDYAHKNGLIHRDVKPSNIIIGEDDHATLTDFGLVKVTADSGFSSSGQVIGSAQYMSPEQAESKTVDDRSDIYSLGIVLFEMLTGQLPFKADSTPSLLYKQVYDAPPSISHIRTDLPKTIELIVNKALAKNPEERFQTAITLSQAFEDTIHEPLQPISLSKVPARPSGTGSAQTATKVAGGREQLAEAEKKIQAAPGGKKSGCLPCPLLLLMGFGALMLFACVIALAIISSSAPTPTPVPTAAPIQQRSSTVAPQSNQASPATDASRPNESIPPSLCGTIPPGMGGLLVVNYYGQEMNYTIAGKFYKIPGNGNQTIFLAPGIQTYSANIPGRGGTNGELYVYAGQCSTQSWAD